VAGAGSRGYTRDMKAPFTRLFAGCVSLAFLATLGAGLLAGCGDPAPQPSPTAGKIVATVNGAPVTRAAVQRAKDAALLTGTALDDKQALRQVVGEELVRQEAERLGVSVTKNMVTERVAKVATAAGGLETLKSQLAASGLTMADLSASVESVLLGEQVEAVKFADLRATRAEARAYYDKNRTLFSTPAAVDLGDIAVRTEAIAQSVVDRIAAGQSFESAARQFSADPELKSASGRLGWVQLSSLPAPARKALGRLKVAEMSAPLQVGPLWHVFKLYGRRAASHRPFAAVAQVVADELTRRQRSEALAKWVDQQRKTAEIVLAKGS
jgi:parvulin-like peptidyl-prolyl isomerase